MNNFMKTAIKEAMKGLENDDGGPFGAVIVRKGEIISKAHNEVIKTNDPTAHAEIIAIRRASAKLKNFDLSDCEIYSTCAPCPMCYAAIHWAKIKKLYYGCTPEDAEEIGFDDKYIYDVIKGTANEALIEKAQINRDECLKPFGVWASMTKKTQY